MVQLSMVETYRAGEAVEVASAGGAWAPAVVVRTNRARRTVIVRARGATATTGVALDRVRRPDPEPTKPKGIETIRRVRHGRPSGPSVKVQTMMPAETYRRIEAARRSLSLPTHGATVRALVERALTGGGW